MISAAVFSHQSSIWRQIAPTLEQYVRWVNSGVRSYGREISIAGPPERNALISEVGFSLAAANLDRVGVDPAVVEERARAIVSRLPRGSAALERLGPLEWRYAYLLSDSIREYLSRTTTVEFSPLVPGCGVVDAAKADVLVEHDQLIEVKAVKRPFRSNDFRQALTYAAMLFASGTSIRAVTLLNPRLQDYATADMDEIAACVSGAPAAELMLDLVASMVELQVSA